MESNTGQNSSEIKCGADNTSGIPPLDEAYWNSQYNANTTGWDLGQVSPPLKAYIDQLTNKNLRILIPGCGNTYVMQNWFNVLCTSGCFCWLFIWSVFYFADLALLRFLFCDLCLFFFWEKKGFRKVRLRRWKLAFNRKGDYFSKLGFKNCNVNSLGYVFFMCAKKNNHSPQNYIVATSSST